MGNLREWLELWRERLAQREPGQGLMEYGLIISVVSIAAVVLIMAMGPRVASMFSSAAAGFPSDRRRKGGFGEVNKQEVLARVAALPILAWTSDGQPAVQRIGPAPRHFYSAFRFGDDETRIPSVDANGVALAAIQGLYLGADERRRRLESLSARFSTIEASLVSATRTRRNLPPL
ncbi:MAG TPA: hypothetical protein VK066_23355 [Chloroflexota bacterium]|nr:hypothetical protein [Chloroflexota bacterium]